MQQNNWWRILNICLGILLLGLIVFIVMLVLGTHTAGDVNTSLDKKQTEEYYKPKDEINEKKTENNSSGTSAKKENVTNNSTKSISSDIDENEMTKTVNVDDKDEAGDDTDEKSSVEDKTDDDKSKDGDEVKLEGKLESADEKKNEYEGNYRMIAEGDTDYTYFWFSGDFKKYVDSLVGKRVMVEVKYNKDGTFEIISGPSEVK